jgi:tetratricopeptide (TPR) repeat protein
MPRKRGSRTLLLCLVTLSTTFLLSHPSQASEVKMWEEEIVIPTYQIGPPEPNPMFYFGRESQGAEGRIYPYPLYDNLTGEKVDKAYRIVYLENEYIRIGILPEIGGRLFEAIDKTNDYHFFYRQHVIKPALISIIGAWISGGIEWNVLHHHRATTSLPVQYRLEEQADGSRTVWVGELEKRHRIRWAVGYTLRPGRSYLENSLRILNRTPVAHTMLCFANAAVHANEDYQVIYPPRTQFVTYHSKRYFTTWPLATTRYGRTDFSDGMDVSWYKNLENSTSMFAWNYEDDFIAGYDHGKQAGTMGIANHHIAPGKKFWTWGHGQGGQAWSKILTDDDGPYIELMVGAYSDNQPDYSWLQPYEVKSFEQYWYPFRDLGGVKQANVDAAVNLQMIGDDSVRVGFYTTAAHPEATVLLKTGKKILLQEKVAIDPANPYAKEVSLPSGVAEEDLHASISAGDRELVAYAPIRLEPMTMPEPVENPPLPEEIETVEELYLTGLRIEQFHDPDREPDLYWEEGLRRDPGDARINTALGIHLLKQGQFAKAENRFRQALARLTTGYTSPKNGEPFYYLGVALKAQGKNDAAFDAFYKATWSAAWKAASYYSLAEIASMRGELPTALDLANRALSANALNIRALNLKAALLRHAGHPEEALDLLETAVDRADPLDVRALAERWLATGNRQFRKTLLSELRGHPATGLETALEYASAGLWQDGTAVLEQMIEVAPNRDAVSPLIYYYLANFAEQLGSEKKATEYYRLAAKMPPDYVFPFQFEAIAVLRRAMEVNPTDARAPYYLGNLLFDWQPEEAVTLWEKSVELDPSFPIAHRNLAVAFSQREEKDPDRAIASLEKAVELKEKYALHFYELDQLYEEVGTAPEKRLALLEKNHDIISQRDDALIVEISLKVFMGKYREAIELMQGRSFDAWEGRGQGDVTGNWTDAHLLRGHQHLAAGRYREALSDYQASMEFPENLQAGMGWGGSRRPEMAYWMGIAYEGLGDLEEAEKLWRESSSIEPRRRRRFRGLSPRNIQPYYQGLALLKLGEKDRAKQIFEGLVESAQRALDWNPDPGFPANFVERYRQFNLTLGHYIAGLGYMGLAASEKAREEFTQTLLTDPNHLGAKTALARLDRLGESP